MKKNLFSILLSLIFFGKSFAQSYDTTTFYGKMNYQFQYLNKSPITTGLLREYGIDYVNIENYNGLTLHDSNWVNLDDWRVIYASLYSQQIVISGNNLLYLDTVNRLLNKFSVPWNPINFVVAYYNYQGFDTNAITKNLITITNGQLHDVAGRTQSPYLIHSVFAVATTSQSIYTGLNQLIFRPELFFGNTGKTIGSIQVDPFGTGSYQTAALNAPLTVNYPDTGLYTVNVKISYTDGTVNLSHTKFAVYSYLGPPLTYNISHRKTNAGTGPPKNNLDYNTTPNVSMRMTADKLYMGAAAQGNFYIDYSANNTSGQIQKPLIFVDGFDSDINDTQFPNSGDNFDFFLQNIYIDNNIPIQTNFVHGLDNTNTYDLIYVQWYNGTDYIERNAYLLEKIISYINLHKTPLNGVMQQNVIIGLSMGGLVSRYALRDMEINGITHDTRLFISHDAPQWGANVPVSIQALVQQVAPWQIPDGIGLAGGLTFKDLFPQAVDALSLFNSPAAKQMLIQRYILTGNTLSADNSTHTSFMNEINTMGWPVNCTNLTLSNGGCSGGTQFPNSNSFVSISGSTGLGTYFGNLWRSIAFSLAGGFANSDATRYVPVRGGALIAQFPLGIITTKGTVNLDFAAMGVPASGISQIYRGNVIVKRQLFWGLFNSTSYLLKSNVNSTSDMLPLDNAPGGTFNLANFGVNLADINSQLQSKLGAWASLSTPQKTFCFVPTVSSLALTNPQTYLNSNVCNTVNCLNPTQVKGFYAAQNSTLHISYTQGIADWVLQVQDPTNNCVKICNTGITMSGINPLCTTSTYSISGAPSGINYTWSATPTSIVTIAPSGSQASVTKQSTGYITLTANLSSCGAIAITKYMHVGGYGSSDYPVTGPSSICKNSYASFSTVSNLPGATGYTWFWPTNTTYSSGQNTPNLTVKGTTPGGGAVGVRVASTCDAGGSPAIQTLVVQSCGFAVSPNPTTGQVTISMNSMSAMKSEATTGNPTTTGSLIYQIKVLDPSGMIKQTANYPNGVSNINVNLGNYLNGVYTIQVFDGVSWSSEQVLIMK